MTGFPDHSDPALLKMLVGTTDAMVLLALPDGRIAWSNPAYRRKTGFTEDEVRNMYTWDQRPQEQRAAARTAYLALGDSTEMLSLQTDWIRKDGSVFRISLATRALRGSDGSVRLRLGTAIDISAETKREEEVANLRTILDRMGDSVFLVELGGRISYANKASEELYGLPVDEIVGRLNRELVPAEDMPSFREFIENVRDTLVPGSYMGPRLRGDGSTVPVQMRVAPLVEGGELMGFVGIGYDATDELALEKRATEAANRAELMAQLIENLTDPVFFVRPDGNLDYVNESCAGVFGFRVEELLDTPGWQLCHEEDFAEVKEFYRSLLKQSGNNTIRVDARHRSGRRIPVEFRVRPIFGPDGELDGFAGVARDLTEQMLMEQELRRLASTDPLTGLMNRRAFLATTAREMERARRHDRALALVTADIDHFKRINDTHGHAAGDHALRAFAAHLAGALRTPPDLAARMGGEEFALLLPETPLEGAVKAAERLRQSIENLHVVVDGQTLHLTASFGVTMIWPTETSLDDALARADFALYRAKDRGRNRVEARPLGPDTAGGRSARQS